MICRWRIFLFNFFILSAVSLAVIISSPVHATIVSGDIVSFWTLDETAAGTYSDSIGVPANDGAVGAGDGPDPTASGQINGAQVFTATNTDGIDIADDNDDFDWAVDANFSIEFWMKGIPGTTAAGANPEVMIGRFDGVNDLAWWIGVNNGTQNITWFIRDSNDTADELQLFANPAVNAADGEWHHIVCVRDADNGKVRLYVDGVETPEVDETFDANFASGAALNLGWYNVAPFYYFNGTLDEVAIYNRALTAAEVLDNFTAQGGPRYFLQSDTDGISDGEENAHPNKNIDGDGDGNEDGIADMNQDTVASLLTESGTDYVTIETSAGTLANCQAVANPSAVDAPPDTDFPWGFFEFTINGVGAGNAATVTFRTPAGTTPETYYKYGPPVPGDQIDWYEFMDDGQTGATINGNVITLEFVDGERGDDTDGTDGNIVDQGAPGTTTTVSSSGGGGHDTCFIATAAYGSLMEPHVKILREFRDRFLLESSIGKAFVNFYYKYSPPIANFITKHANLRSLVRISLLPIVGISWAALKLGLLPTIALMFFFSICLIGATIFKRKKVKN